MRFTASLETFGDGSCLGWVHELPGCAARVTHRTLIERALAGEIRRFLAELGEPVPEQIELAVAVEIEVEGEGAEATAALIEPDRAPLGPMWPRIESWLAASRRRLLARLDAGEDPERLREEVRHIGVVELIHAARTFDLGTTDGLRAYLDWSRGVTLDRLAAAAAVDTGAVSEGGEPWTAAKVARRLLWHERLHLPKG